DTSQFLTFSIHCPFNKIWASLSIDCPSHSSQYGYNLGIVNQQRIMNDTQMLYICSFHSQPIQAAIRASLYKTEGVIPGGCGIGSSRNFSSSTIETHWWNENGDLLDNTAERLRWWTSTIRFYAASPAHTDSQSCGNLNSSFFDDLIYRIYYIPLVTSGGSVNTFSNPTPIQVLQSLGHLSSYGEAPLRGTLVGSFKARDLRLFEDNSHEIQVARHLGTAAVYNVIAEYKMNTYGGIESSTFVAYAPTVLYTCPHSEKSSDAVRSTSDQLTCDLLENASVTTKMCIGVIFVGATLYALAGSFYVWFRCGVAIFLTLTYFCLLIFYGYVPSEDKAGYVVVAGLIIPMALACVLMIVIYLSCFRRSHVPGAPPLTPDIFHPGHGPTTYGSFNWDHGWNQFDSNPYPVHSSQSPPCPIVPPSSSSQVDIGRSSGQLNLFRLWRLTRLVSIFPAILLLTSFIMQLALEFLGDALRNVCLHFTTFVIVYLVLLGLMFKYKNLSFGVSVGLTGLYVILTSVALLGVKNSLLPYVLLDEFLVLAWPKERLRVFNIPAYGRNDIIFLIVWLVGSIVIGLITLCTLRLSDSHQHHSAARRARFAPAGNPTEADSSIGCLEELRNRWRRRRRMGPFAATALSVAADEIEPIVPSADVFDSIPIPQSQPPPSRLSESISQAMSVWPPVPMGPAPLFTGSRNEVFGTNPTLITYPPPIAPMSRAEWREVRERNRLPRERSTEEGANSPTGSLNPFGSDEDHVLDTSTREPHPLSTSNQVEESKAVVNQSSDDL
ncbi:unnamed protein product, partial [Hymenolepis diminuta]